MSFKESISEAASDRKIRKINQDIRQPTRASRSEAGLASSQVRRLKSIAQKLDPVIKIGKQGISTALLKSVNDVLDARELIKVKFDEFKEQKKELASMLAEKTNSHLVTLIGNVAVLYRQNPDPTRRIVEP